MPNKTLQHVNYNGTTYDIDAVTVNGHTVQSDVPASYDWDRSKVELSELTASGNKVGKITIDGTGSTLYAPAYTGTSPISVNSSTLKISHANSGVTADTYGITATTALTPDFGASFSVPGFTVNATGHVTAAGAHNVTLPTIQYSPVLTSGTKIGTITINGSGKDLYAPTNTNTTYTLSKDGNDLKLTPSSGSVQTVTLNLATDALDGLMSKDDKEKLDGINGNANDFAMAAMNNSGKAIATWSINGENGGTIYEKRDIFYATCPTAAATAAKVATTTNGDFELITGAIVTVKFTYQQSYNDTATLNVDNTGAKDIATYGTTKTSRYYWAPGEVVTFVYDGTNFVMENSYPATTTYYGVTKLSSATDSTSTSLAATPSAVKAAYDAATAAQTTANSKSIVTNTPAYSDTGTTFLVDTMNIDGVASYIRIPNYPTAESLGLSRALKFIGITTTKVTDGQTTAPTVSGVTSYTPTIGDVVIDGSDDGSTITSQWEYVYTSANKWERLGGDLDYAINGEVYDVTNGGSNAASAVTISPKTTTMYSMASTGEVQQGTESSLVMTVTGEKLTFNYIPNTPTEVTLPSRGNATTVWTGYNTGVANTYAAAQSFTPTTKTIELGVTS